MDMHVTDEADEPIAETPEDVAILYSWANLHGARYRDFSASRREYRAQVRHRAAEETRQAELVLQAEAELAAAEAERMAHEAEVAVRTPDRFDSSVDRERALRTVEDAGRRATSERVEAARRAEAAALAEAAARREEREIAVAHVSAERQAALWQESEIRRRSLAGPQPAFVPQGDPYEMNQGATVDASLPSPNRALEYTQPQVYDSPRRQRDDSTSQNEVRGSGVSSVRGPRNQRGYKPDQPSGITQAYRHASGEMPLRTHPDPAAEPTRNGSTSSRPAVPRPSVPRFPQESQQAFGSGEMDPRGASSVREPLAPAWLTETARSSNASSAAVRPGASGTHTVTDTLQQSREKVASRWFAMKGVFDHEAGQGAEMPPRALDGHTPVFSVFSIAGGVGKTSLVATLGRALSSLGEKVLLADTTSHGLLPYYFGATELKPGVVRTFSPPKGSSDAPIRLVGYDADLRGNDTAAKDKLAERLNHDASSVQRLLVDLNSTSGWLIRRLPQATQTVLVLLAPDMNSVISLQGVEKYFGGETKEDGTAIIPHYLLNGFDASQPLHLDVREVLRRQLGERLLPFVLRRSPAVSEALAEGMTVMDYRAESGISEDYLNLAQWLQSVSAAVTKGFRATRWSER